MLRVHRRTGFTQVPNEVLRDQRLSWKARGVLCYLLSHSDGYRFNRDQLAAEAPDGVTAVRSALAELTAAELRALRDATPASANYGHATRLILECAYLRRALAFSWELQEQAYAGRPQLLDVARLVERAPEALVAPIDTVQAGIDVNELVAQDHPRRWLVPQLIERRDRVVLTGSEGFGKTTMTRQWCLALAAGLDPLGFRPIRASRVVHVDLQEKEPQSSQQYRWIMRRTGVQVPPGQLTVVHRRQGMNLLGMERRWVEGLLQQHRPDLLAIGPVYKAWKAPAGQVKHSEETVEELHAVLDRITERYDVALLLEAHSPHGEGGNRADWRPYGASAWLRWPEFGIALQKMEDGIKLKHWRGARDRARDWPEVLVEGKAWPFATLAGEGEALL